jgi:AcrR family transcriptional regulator
MNKKVVPRSGNAAQQRITEKVRDLLFTKTEEEITMNLIAEELNVTAPTIYHYFTGKDELLAAGNNLIFKEISACLNIKFPPSVPPEMKIITTTVMVADYFMKNGLPAFYLTEDPREKPVNLKEFRKKFTAMFSEYFKTAKGKTSGAEHTAIRYLALIQAEIVYYRNLGKPLPEDFSEKIFSVIF